MAVAITAVTMPTTTAITGTTRIIMWPTIATTMRSRTIGIMIITERGAGVAAVMPGAILGRRRPTVLQQLGWVCQRSITAAAM